ncbi:MAG TPA: RMD1 family protein [bacterium]|mgnify:CR=1 FL=1|nr:RMD1 family protein [bacterium]HOL47240.1 RMD1 family protein [bacterium]HPQ19276.1 RMD1 family protein [bacterium]
MINVKGYYYNSKIDLKKFREKLKAYKILSIDPIIFEPISERFVIITKFGVVIFWNPNEEIKNEIINELAKFLEDSSIDERVSDELEIEIGEFDYIDFEKVSISSITPEKVKIISLAMAQSIALNKFELEMENALTEIEKYIHQIKDTGKVRFSAKKILQSIGLAISMKYHVISNLTLFDKPEETWEHIELRTLFKEIREYFDLDDRHYAINIKLEFITDNIETLLDVINTKKAHTLELIIILLIFFEIVYPWLMKLF